MSILRNRNTVIALVLLILGGIAAVTIGVIILLTTPEKPPLRDRPGHTLHEGGAWERAARGPAGRATEAGFEA